MTVFLNNMKRLLRRKLNIAFMIVIPVALISFIMAASKGGTRVAVGVADNDNTKLTKIIEESLKTNCKIVKMSEEEIQDELIATNIEYALVIDKGFTQDIIDGKDPVVKSYSIKELDAAAAVRINLESLVNTAKNIGRASAGDSSKFYEGMNAYTDGSFGTEYKKIENNNADRGNTLTSLGFLVMCILYLSTFSPMLILEDKEKKTYNRMFSTPLKVRSYMLQNIMSFVALAVIQIILILLVLTKLFKAQLGPSIPSMFAVMLVFSVVAVAMGVVVSSISKDMRQAGTIGSLISTPICMLGGCFWSRDLMPELLKKIGDFVPTTWALKAAEKVMDGSTIAGVSKELGILMLFAVVFLLLSSWKKTDVAN